MKKTFLAILLAGGTMSLFAQTPQSDSTMRNNPTSDTTTQATQATGVTGDTSTVTGDPSSNINNTQTSNATTTGNWNGVSTTSTSWAPEKDPSWGWNSYGIWNNSANWNANSNNPSANASASMNTTGVNADASMNSTGTYSAYGTAVPYLPANIQMRFNQDFPANVNTSYKWNQYGDWYHTYYMNNGRLTQYFYDQRGAGYALVLPVLQTYVPENIVTSALNKYGSNLYSIGMVKTSDSVSTNAYQIGLIQGGQLVMQYLDENGATVNNVWRIEDSASMQSMQSNAAMDGSSGNMPDANMNNDTQNDQSSGSEIKEMKVKDDKTKIEYKDGTEVKIKTDEDGIKVKTDKSKTKIKKD